MTFSLPDYPTAFWISAVAAVLLVGIAKAGFGGGGGVIATPLMSLTIPPAEAAALLLILLIIIDWVMLPHYRHHYDRPSLKFMFIGAVIGIVIGSLFFHFFASNERILKIMIGLLALLYIVTQTAGWPKPDALKNSPILRPLGIVMGAISGFTSTLVHAGGPPVSVYLLAQDLSKEVFVGTIAIFFLVVNLAKLIPYSLLGLFEAGDLVTILILSPLCFIGARLGIYLNGRTNPVIFNRIVYVLLFLTGAQLIIGQSFLGLLFS
jgi:hypothetical protein